MVAPPAPERKQVTLAPEPVPILPVEDALSRPGGGLFGFIEDEGTTIVALAGIASLALILPASHWSNELVRTLATGGFLGVMCLLPASVFLSIFLFLRRASLIRILAPFGVAVGLLIGFFVTSGFYLK